MSKYDQVQLPFCFAQNPKMFSAQEMEKFYHIARDAGIKNLVMP